MACLLSHSRGYYQHAIGCGDIDLDLCSASGRLCCSLGPHPASPGPLGRQMSDILSDMLRVVRLRGAIFSYVECTDPWVAETPRSREIIAAIMRGVEHLMPFHAVATGTCWASLVDDEPVRLDAGDLALFPLGDHHIMSSAPGLRAKAVDPSVYFAPKPDQLPFELSVTESGLSERRESAAPIRNTVVCGFLGCDS